MLRWPRRGPSKFETGPIQQEVVRVVHADAAQLLDVDKPWNMCTDPGQAAALSLAGAGCQLARHSLLLDHRQREIDLDFFSPGAVCQA
eukprot:2843655-Pyramimonas_sp.AAC.1